MLFPTVSGYAIIHLIIILLALLGNAGTNKIYHAITQAAVPPLQINSDQDLPNQIKIANDITSAAMQGAMNAYCMRQANYDFNTKVAPQVSEPKFYTHNLEATSNSSALNYVEHRLIWKYSTGKSNLEGVVRQVVRTIGEEREVARNLNISLEERLRTNVDRVAIEPPPEGYADGHRIGAGDIIGMLRTVLDDSKRNEKDEYGICGFDNQYQRLLKYAQHFKQNANSHGCRKVEIDCCNKSWERKGEEIEPIALNKKRFPLSVYVLRLDIDGVIYYFLDCEFRDKQSSSGIVVKVSDEERFLYKLGRGYTLMNLLDILRENYGRLSQSVYDEIGVNGLRKDDIVIAKYKHMNEETSNWVLSGLRKLRY